MRGFVRQVKNSILRQSHFFNFFDVPDLMVKAKVNKADYVLL